MDVPIWERRKPRQDVELPAPHSGRRDSPREREQVWLAAAEMALAKNASTFALLPISDLLADDGHLSKVQQRGYELIPPR